MPCGAATSREHVLAKVRTWTARVIPLRDRNPTVRTPGRHDRSHRRQRRRVLPVVQQGGALGDAATTAELHLRAMPPSPARSTQRPSAHGARDRRRRHVHRRGVGDRPERSRTRTSPLSRSSCRCSCTAAWLHLGGNMLFLWVFGNNIEDRSGRFFVPRSSTSSAVLVATLAQFATDPSSTVPLIGASGAIAGGRWARTSCWFPTRPVLTVIADLLLPAARAAGWLVLGVLVRARSSSPSSGTGVAWVAHVGGFVFGVVSRPASLRNSRVAGARRSAAPTYRWTSASTRAPGRAQSCRASARPAGVVGRGDAGEHQREAVAEHARQPAVGVGTVADDRARRRRGAAQQIGHRARTACRRPPRVTPRRALDGGEDRAAAGDRAVGRRIGRVVVGGDEAGAACARRSRRCRMRS